jgi:hypothetical protein
MSKLPLKLFFESTLPPPEGFEIVNQGVTALSPNQGSETSPDASELPGEETGSEGIVWSPGEYGADVEKILSKLHGLDGLRQKLKDAGAYAEIELDFQESEQLKSAVQEFLADRSYSKPTVQFAEELLSQLNPEAMAEGVDLQKSSEKEKDEHPWMSNAQAYQVAKDHKMENVFIGKRKL